MADIRALLISLLLHLARSAIYLPCEDGEFVKQEGCSCWNPQAPIIICKSLGLTSIPEITKAHTIDLDGNNLTTIPARAFASIMSLGNIGNFKRLILTNNNIKTIDDDAFARMESSLEMLDLRGNELSAIPNLFSRDVTLNLTHLDLSDNYIPGIRDNAFRSLKGLQHLYLEKNQISYISPDAWMGPTKLSTLAISSGGMDITSIPSKNIQGLSALVLSRGRAHKLSYLRPWFESFPELQHLTMTQMGLLDEDLAKGTLPSGWRMKLRSLILNDNTLTSVPWHLFTFPILQELDLSNNLIEVITGYRIVSPFPRSLKKLNISNNAITNLHSNLLLQLTTAEYIDFSNNRIRGLNWSTRQIDQDLPAMVVLHIGNNPWACMCGYAWIKVLMDRQLATRNGHLTTEEINNSIRCGPSGNREGQLIRDVPMNVFDCSGRGK